MEIFFQHIKKRVSQLLLCSIVIQNIQIFYRGPVMYIVTCFLTQTGCRNFLPEHCNTIIKQQLRGEKLRSLLSFVQVDFFSREAEYIAVCDTNNSTQSLTLMYHHTATESLYHLHGVKISWTPTLAGVSYQFGFFCFSVCLQCKISGSTVFSNFFPHKVSHHKVRKVMGPNFWKTFRLAWLGGFKRSQTKVFRVFAKFLSI